MSIQPGQRLPNFRATSTTGTPVHSIDYRQRCNLLLVFLDGSWRDLYLDAFATAAESLSACNTQVVAIVPDKDWATTCPFVVVSDPERSLYGRFGVEDAAVVLCDRFLVIRKIFWVPQPLPLPEPQEVLEWMEFIDLSCHDCATPLW